MVVDGHDLRTVRGPAGKWRTSSDRRSSTVVVRGVLRHRACNRRIRQVERAAVRYEVTVSTGAVDGERADPADVGGEQIGVERDIERRLDTACED
jgi:hypothetical protein